MSTTVTLTPDDLPDVTATLDDSGYYEISITGLLGLAENPRALTKAESDAGIVSVNPPTVRTDDPEQLELLMLRTVEIGLPVGMLDNVEGVQGAVDLEHLLLAQLTRVVRRARIALEPPT